MTTIPEDSKVELLDVSECAACCSKGWNWIPLEGVRPGSGQRIKCDCEPCKGLGFVGPDAQKLQDLKDAIS